MNKCAWHVCFEEEMLPLCLDFIHFRKIGLKLLVYHNEKVFSSQYAVAEVQVYHCKIIFNPEYFCLVYNVTPEAVEVRWNSSQTEQQRYPDL